MRRIEIICDICGFKLDQGNAVGVMYSIVVKDAHISITPWNFATANIAHLHQKDLCRTCVQAVAEWAPSSTPPADGGGT